MDINFEHKNESMVQVEVGLDIQQYVIYSVSLAYL